MSGISPAPPVVPVFSPRAAASPISAQSQLSNGAEELTFGRTSSPRNRRQEISKSLPQHDRLARVKQVLAMMRMSATAEQRYPRIQLLARRAAQAQGDLAAALLEEGASPEECMLALQMALDAEADGAKDDPQLRQRILDAQQSLDEDYGEIIRGRLAALEVSLESNVPPSEIAAFQDGYVALLLGNGSFVGLIDDILKRFQRRLRHALTLMKRALGAELDSHWPSCDPEYLLLLMQMLAEASAISTVLDECEELCEKWHKGSKLNVNDPVQLTRDLLKLSSEPWVTAYRYNKLADAYAASRARAMFLERLRRWTRNMPDRLFYDDAARVRVDEALQEALDKEAGAEDL